MNRDILIIKINNAMEDILTEYYTEQNISTGDITPWQLLEWDRLLGRMADLFIELADGNRK